MVNKPLNHRRICRWLFLFQGFEFEFILRPDKAKVRSDHLLRITIGEESTGIEDYLPNPHLFRDEFVPSNLAEISQFLEEGQAL